MNLLRNLFSTKHTGKAEGVKSGRSCSSNRMSCCDGSPAGERLPGTGCCGTSCAGSKTGCSASEPRIRTCLCQTNVGCLDRPDCGGFRPRGTAETGACPGPCQCEIEDSWNRNIPPKPNCEWVSNFTELRRQWSDHGRRESCKCCSCRPSRPSTPCRPCIPCPPVTPCCSSTSVSYPKRDACKPPSDPCARNCCEGSRLGGGGCQPCCSPSPSGCCPSPSNNKPCCLPPNCCPPQNFCPPPPDCCPSPCESDNRPPAGSCPPPGCCPPPSCGAPPCGQSPACQPCAPQPRPILKKRSCCLCPPAGCMCQPMPRNCSCPPPVQIDARADDECSCDCPSSPECACPPSERRFSRTKVKCQNARMCCPLPRLPPGPPCCCTECRPCLPPPCDPCSSSRCCSPTPRFKFCRPSSPCPPCSPCRPSSPVCQTPCRPSTPCSPCRKPSRHSPCRSLTRTSSRGSSCCSPCRAPGQSSSCYDDNGEVEAAGCGDDEREQEFAFEMPNPQCRCGPDGKGCADDCNWCCSRNCADAHGDLVYPGVAMDNDHDRVLNVTEFASAEKLPTANQIQAQSPAMNAQASFKPQLIPPAQNAAARAPGTQSAPGWTGSPRLLRRIPYRMNRIPGGGGTALPGTARKIATPALNRTPIGTNALYNRLALKRRSGLGVLDRVSPAVAVQAKPK